MKDSLDAVIQPVHPSSLRPHPFFSDVTTLSAMEIAREIASGAISAREVLEAHIARIEEINPKLNAVVVKLYERARKEADNADAARAHGEALGPLHGVPLTVKESFDVEGTPTTMGMGERAGHLATKDAPLVKRLRNAGGIILCKTNVPQMLFFNESDNPVYGRTNNPWNERRAPGGSSGGEAAIIAAGGAPLGLGSDIGGSIRLPSHACGIQVFKPTSGRLTMVGHSAVFAGQEAILAQPGPMARSVSDLILAMKILCAPGQEAFDPSIPPVPLRDPAQVKIETLRVAMYTDNGFFTPSPALRRAVREAAETLRARGAVVEEWMPPDMAEASRIYLGLLFADGMAHARRALGRSKRDWRIKGIVRSATPPKKVLKGVASLFALAQQKHMADAARSIGKISVDDYWQLTAERTRYRARFIAAMDEGRFDAIICPPDALPALLHGSSFYLADALSYTYLYNLLGMPAGVVAATRVREGEESDRVPGRDFTERRAKRVEANSQGLPIGVQVVARHWREDVALAIMSALEKRN